MGRRVFAFACLLSLLTCIVCGVVLVRSFWVADEWECYRYFADNVVATRRSFFLRTDHGSTYVAYRMVSGPATPAALTDRVDYHWQIDMPGLQPSWYFKPPTGRRLRPQWTVWDHAELLWASTAGPMGFSGFPQRQIILRFPTLLLVGIVAILPLAHWRVRRRRKHRIDNRLCAACAYNLTGNTSGVCPECGEPVKLVQAPVEFRGKAEMYIHPKESWSP